LHSGLDLLAAIITFLSVRMSDQPADEKHPYGHGKFENFLTGCSSTTCTSSRASPQSWCC
jgi:divalent metal cation (Fe/Co/Zn/Cd) transporter